jgi:hypothetical protein
LFYIYFSVLPEESDKNLIEDSQTPALTSAKCGLRKETTNTVGKEIWGNEKRRNFKGNFKLYGCGSRLCIFQQYVNENIGRGKSLHDFLYQDPHLFPY